MLLKISLVYLYLLLIMIKYVVNERVNAFNPNLERSRRTDNARGTEKNDWLGSFYEKKYKTTGNEHGGD